MSDPGTVTHLLGEWGEGSRDALDRLIPLVYDELRRIAARRMSGERRSNLLLQPTVLINEAYLRLVPVRAAPSSRAQFFGLASVVMRRVLVDYARKHVSDKRGGGSSPLTLDDIADVRQALGAQENMLALEGVLERFRAKDAKRAVVFDLYFFWDCTLAEIATLLERPVATVGRQLTFARAWVQNELEGKPAS